SYADLDGTPPAASRWLLTDLLRDTWGFDGTVVADYWAVSFLQSMHRVVEDDRAAAIAALTAGLDIELPESTAYPHLVAAVREGELDEQDRKSTRLNSSHVSISYAVFCLKKKTQQ